MSRTTPALDLGTVERVHLYATGRAWSTLPGTPMRQLPGELHANLYADVFDAAGGKLWGAGVTLLIEHAIPPQVTTEHGDPIYPALRARVLTWRADVLRAELRADTLRMPA